MCIVTWQIPHALSNEMKNGKFFGAIKQGLRTIHNPCYGNEPILHHIWDSPDRFAAFAGLYSDPPHFDMVHARKEFEITCYSAVKDLLNKTGG